MSTAHPVSRAHRSRTSPGRSALSRLPLALATAGLGSLTLLVVAAYISRIGDVALADLLRDTAATLGAPAYIGLVSNVGILLWGACTSICLFTASVASRTGRAAGDVRFFLAGAAVSAWLLADDALMLHEQVFPEYLGIPGEWSLAIGFCATAAFLLVFHRAIRASAYPVLASALVLLALSAGIDRLHDLHLLGSLTFHSNSVEIVLEDGLKLFGITLWSMYFTLSAADLLSSPEA